MGPFLAGFQLSLALILAIGPQNAFVLRQGLRREHVLAVVLFCGLSDAVLMGVGVAGLRAASDAFPFLQTLLRLAGGAFLVWYGVRALYSAVKGTGALDPASGKPVPLAAILWTLALVTWANPHVWLDTVVLVGSVAAQYPEGHVAFWAGAATASLSFFAALGYGARLLAPVFSRPGAWRVLDGVVGILMLTLAVTVLAG